MLATLFLLLAAAGVPDAGPTGVSPSKFRFEVPGALDEADVPGMLQANGLPLKLRAVRSKLSLRELTDHFTATFEKAGLYLPPAEDLTAPGPHVTGYDPKKHISYTALFQPNTDGTVTVILSEVYVHARQEPAPFVPVFPGASAPLDTQAEGSKSLQYTTGAPAKDVTAFYRDVMGKTGCREEEPLSFRCGLKLNRVWVRERPGQPTSVTVQQTEAPP